MKGNWVLRGTKAWILHRSRAQVAEWPWCEVITNKAEGAEPTVRGAEPTAAVNIVLSTGMKRFLLDRCPSHSIPQKPQQTSACTFGH